MENGYSDPDVGLEARCHIDRVCDQFEEAWQAKETPRIDAYLERVPPEGRPLATAELIALEVALRHDAGEPVAPDEYYGRFPAHAAAVEAAFAAVAPLHPKKRRGGGGFPRRGSDRKSDMELGCPAAVDGPERFVVRRRLGAGGMGVVYLAYDRKREEWVALKTIRRTEASAIYRMKREFRSLADVVHPNLVRLHELFFERDRWFFTMEYVEGLDFLTYLHCGNRESPAQPDRCGAAPTPTGRHEHATENADEGTTRTGRANADGTELQRAPNAENETAVFLRWAAEQVHPLRNALGQLVEGISAIHRCGRLHRDIKPSNAMVTPAGRVVLLDFGLITEGGREAWEATTGQHIVGTAAYMSPEQAAGTPLSEASDWYSVGVVLFEALTGQRPFVGSPTEVLIGKQSREAPTPKSLAADIPDDLAALCVDLLHRDPAKRPSSPEILRRLAREDAAATAEQASSEPNVSSNAREMPFFGRAAQLEMLHDAVRTVEAGGAVVVHVRGQSGAGKSALVEHFLGGVRRRPDAVVLAGRCYERESVPYKALDSPIDALSHYLACLPRHEADALMPREVGALSQVFPVLERVEAVAGAPHREAAIPDRQELRQKAFDALRDLLARLGDRRLLVLWIDDLQWGDLDSLGAWGQLLRPPDPPALLLLTCYRSEYAATSPVLRAMLAEDSELRRLIDVQHVEVGDLSFEEARNLAAVLIDESSPAADHLSNTIALESGGNPYFVDRLVRHYQVESRGPDSGDSATDLSLDGVLWGYIEGIPASARRLLEVVAAAGYPLPVADACRAAELEGPGAVEVEMLSTWNLLRTTSGGEQEQVEPFHDRVRETVVAHMPPEVLRGCHERLADVLEGSGRADPATLASHFLQAGNAPKASTWYALAALEAAEALAFDRAVELYRRVLELGVDGPDERREVRRHLADALANAGRGGEAGQEYLILAESATGSEAVELRRRAATQLLISGHVKEGMQTLREVLEAVHLKLPEGRVATLVPLLLRRARLRLRGLRFRQRREEDIPPEALRRIDVGWSAGMGLSLVEPLRAAYFLTHSLLLALRWGEPQRVARSLAFEAAHVAAAGGFASRRAERLFRRARVLAEEQRSTYLEGLILLAEGASACLWGQWNRAVERCEKSLHTLRTRCEGVWWEVDTASSWILYSLACAGQLDTLNQRLANAIREASQRGDHYVLAHMATLVLPQLAAGDPDGAERQLKQRPGQWPHGGFHVQHFDELHAQLTVDLYRGEGLTAWNRVADRWAELARSLMLRAQCARGHIYDARGRCALAAAAEVADPAPFWKAAGRDAQRLHRERQPWIEPLAEMIDAGLAVARGAESEVERLLRAAIHGFDAADMPLLAAVARRRLGELLGGEEGRRLVEEANAWMTAQGIRDPARMARLFAPFRTN